MKLLVKSYDSEHSNSLNLYSSIMFNLSESKRGNQFDIEASYKINTEN